MFTQQSTLLTLALLVLSITGQAMQAELAPRRVHWQNIPIPINLSVGDERRIQFQAPVSVGVPASLQALLRTQTVNGTVYLLANAPFPKTRILVRELDAGQTYLLDLQASVAATANEPIVIEPRPAMGALSSNGRTAGPATQSYVALTRFAAQQLFAPLRLVSPPNGVARIPVQQDSVLLLPGDAVEATPLMAWRAGTLFLTAVKLRNRSREAQLLDPRRLRGNWLAATFQHARLLPSGTVADSTAVYLISAQPFAASF